MSLDVFECLIKVGDLVFLKFEISGYDDIFFFQPSGFQLIFGVLDAQLFLFNIGSGAKPRFCVRLSFETEFLI